MQHTDITRGVLLMRPGWYQPRSSGLRLLRYHRDAASIAPQFYPSAVVVASAPSISGPIPSSVLSSSSMDSSSRSAAIWLVRPAKRGGEDKRGTAGHRGEIFRRKNVVNTESFWRGKPNQGRDKQKENSNQRREGKPEQPSATGKRRNHRHNQHQQQWQQQQQQSNTHTK